MAKKFQTHPEKDKAAARADLADKKKKGNGKATKPANGDATLTADTPLGLAGGAVAVAKPESIKLHFDEMMKRKRTAASSNSKVRAQNAVAKKDNVDTNILSKVLSFADMDPRDVEFQLQELLRYLDVCMPEVQLELDVDVTVSREAQIFEEGFREGRAAKKNTADNPHQPSSIQWFCWDSGFGAGQKKNANMIAKTPAKDSHGSVPGADKEARH